MKRRHFFGQPCKIFCFSLGLFSFIIGLLLLVNFDSIYDFIIKKALDVRPGTDAFEAWRVNEPPLSMDIHFFNWTNAHEIWTPGVKPKFQPVGPYRYKEVKEKINITMNDNGTVTYKYIKRYYFIEEESPRKLDDVVTVINLIPLAAALKMKNMNYWAKKAFSLTLSAMSDLYVTKTVSQMMFEGFEDNFLSTVHALSNVQDKFGWFYNRNNTGPPDVYNVHVINDDKFGKIMELNYRNRTDFYEDHCGELRGSAGEFHPMNLKRDTLTIYSSEMCRYQTLYYEDDVEIKNIKAYKYSATNIFDNGTAFPENKCFCAEKCLPSGVLNISSCREGAPVFLSLPHFYGADPFYTNAIEGLKPEKEKHDFYLTLEPKTAITVDCAGRMQLNVLLQPIKHISMYENVPEVMIPVFYFDQVVPVQDEIAPFIYILQNMPEINKYVSISFIIFGTVLIGWVVICFILTKDDVEKDKLQKYNITSKDTPEEVPLRTVNL